MLQARISPRKGHDILIKALADLRDLPWTSVFIGDTAENPRISENLKDMLHEYQLLDRVKFVGHCSDMPAAYMLADIVISAASTEPEAFGRVAVEAGAMGKPVIATAHGGSLETVMNEETGLHVNPNDPESLRSAVLRMLNEPGLRQQLGEQGILWVRKRYSVKKMCESTLMLYNKLLQTSD